MANNKRIYNIRQSVDTPCLAFEDELDGTIIFEEINPCGIFCRQNHPFATVERYGDWYVSRGRDREAGLHSPAGKWQMITRNQALALRTAKGRIESPS